MLLSEYIQLTSLQPSLNVLALQSAEATKLNKICSLLTTYLEFIVRCLNKQL